MEARTARRAWQGNGASVRRMRVSTPDRQQGEGESQEQRLRRASTLRRLGLLYSSQGNGPAAEEAFAAALRIADEAGDAPTFAVTLVHRGHHRLEAGQEIGGVDWGTALALAVGAEANLTQQIVATMARWTRDRCMGGRDDRLLSGTLSMLIQTAEATAAKLPLDEPQQATLSVVLSAFRVIGAICARHEDPDASEAADYEAAARAGAPQVDRLTSGAFALTELVAQRLH
jgi:hypothetical protein